MKSIKPFLRDQLFIQLEQLESYPTKLTGRWSKIKGPERGWVSFKFGQPTELTQTSRTTLTLWIRNPESPRKPSPSCFFLRRQVIIIRKLLGGKEKKTERKFHLSVFASLWVSIFLPLLLAFSATKRSILVSLKETE